ncbi:hypothetical protein B0H14DRAFT_3629234 [Mycena olivaceomarginata]|nr:hypothetical protein B0H14DRAFT_3629234 [Mycena olivaceomarginata]
MEYCGRAFGQFRAIGGMLSHLFAHVVGSSWLALSLASRHCGILFRPAPVHPAILPHMVIGVGFEPTPFRTQLVLPRSPLLLFRPDLARRKNTKTMSANRRAIDDTEDEFQAALATYTKVGNKTAAMRRLWNAAYEKGKMAVVAAEARLPVPTPEESRDLDIGAAKLRGFAEGRRAGFEEGRRVGEKGAMTVDAVELVFASGKADGMETGREKENLRWKKLGHFEDGTCRSVTSATAAGAEADPSSPFANTTDVMSVLTGFDWADDAESLPIHATSLTPRQLRDLSGLCSGSKNPFSTLQRRHTRHYGSHANLIRRRNFYTTNPA